MTTFAITPAINSLMSRLPDVADLSGLHADVAAEEIASLLDRLGDQTPAERQSMVASISSVLTGEQQEFAYTLGGLTVGIRMNDLDEADIVVDGVEIGCFDAADIHW